MTIIYHIFYRSKLNENFTVKLKPEEKLKANLTYTVFIEQKDSTCKYSYY